MKRYLLICGFALLFLCACSGHTPTPTPTNIESPGITPSLHVVGNDHTELSEQELLAILLADGTEVIPESYVVTQRQAQTNDLRVTVISIKTGQSRAAQYHIFLRLEQNEEIKILPLIENPMAFEVSELAISALDHDPVIGIAGKSDDTLMLYFYAVKAGLVLEGYTLANHIPPDDHITVTRNHIAIADAGELSVYPGKEPVLFQIESHTAYRYALIHKYEWYAKEEAYTLTFMDGSWALRVLAEQYARLYDAYEAYPFDTGIPEIVEQNTELLLQKPWRLPLPDDYACLDVDKGDLNGDGLDDMAVIIEQRPGMESGSRMLYVMLAQEDGRFHVRWQNGSLLLGRAEGGVFGDPCEGMSIDSGELRISHYGGSSDRWGFTHTFAILEDELVLTNYSELQHSTHTTCGTRLTYYILTGEVEERSDAFGDGMDRLLLCSYTLEPGQKILFSDGEDRPWRFSIPHMDDPDPPLPSLYRVQFGEPAWEEPAQLSASQALDIVKNTLYPTFEKQHFRYAKEIMDNYKAILCYEIPSYYYTDGSTTLSYSGQSDPIMVTELIHYIRMRTNDADDWGVDIRVMDSTGVVDND